MPSLACGVIYKIVPDGTNSQETVLYSFCSLRHCADGAGPVGAPLVDSQGNIFGATYEGGDYRRVRKYGGFGAGTAFELTGTMFNVLHLFCQKPHCRDGAFPDAGVINDGSGHLLGTTDGGGAYSGKEVFNGGTVYELTPNP
jgi:hypothetical protein